MNLLNVNITVTLKQQVNGTTRKRDHFKRWLMNEIDSAWIPVSSIFLEFVLNVFTKKSAQITLPIFLRNFSAIIY